MLLAISLGARAQFASPAGAPLFAALTPAAGRRLEYAFAEFLQSQHERWFEVGEEVQRALRRDISALGRGAGALRAGTAGAAGSDDDDGASAASAGVSGAEEDGDGEEDRGGFGGAGGDAGVRAGTGAGARKVARGAGQVGAAYAPEPLALGADEVEPRREETEDGNDEEARGLEEGELAGGAGPADAWAGGAPLGEAFV